MLFILVWYFFCLIGFYVLIFIFWFWVFIWEREKVYEVGYIRRWGIWEKSGDGKEYYQNI